MWTTAMNFIDNANVEGLMREKNEFAFIKWQTGLFLLAIVSR
jgi:hypothetical protein